jgi:cell division protein FtsL
MKAKIETLKEEKIMVVVAFWTVIFLSLVYVYFMNQTVFNVAKRANLEQEIVVRNSNISDLEFKIIALKNNIDIKLAYSLGYKDMKDPRYVSKTPATALLSFNTVQ